MMVDWGLIINQAPSAALALLFAWFALKLLDRMDRAQERRDDAWREFLIQEREVRRENTARLAGELSENTINMMALTRMLKEHDARAGEAIAVILDREAAKNK
jgi:hypothetical protein